MAENSARIRKAWSVSVPQWFPGESSVKYGATAGKVRYLAWLDISEVWCGMPITAVRVVRARHADIHLPAEHPVVSDLTKEERHVILHAFGGNQCGSAFYRAGYRDHFVCSAGNPDLCRLVARGLMEGPYGREDNASFHLNWMGKRVAQSMLPVYAP